MANYTINSLKYKDTYIFTIPYGTCSTAAGTAAKAVTVDNFSLETGAKVAVKFTVANTATSPTLNVNGLGAKAIYYNGAAIIKDYLKANKVYEFIYNGTQWDFVGDINTDEKVTSVGNHYTPSTNEGSKLSAAAVGAAAAAWNSTSMVTGVTLNRDAAGHVTGISVDSIKMPANPDTNTSHSHSAGVGLVGSGSSGTSGGTYTYKAKLKSETALTNDSAAATETSGRIYPVAVDKSGYLAVNVPWTDTNTNTTYSAGDGLSLSGTTFSHKDTSSQASVSASGRKYITGVTLDSYGHVTGLTTGTETVTDTNTTYDLSASASKGNGSVSIDLTAGGSGSGTDSVMIKGSGYTTVTTDATKVITVDTSITAADLGLSNALHFIGVKESVPTTGTYVNGDVILVGNKEYVYNDLEWVELGDGDSHALKTIKVTANNGLTGGGTLASDITISHADTSSQNSISASGRKYITGVTLDNYGHVTGLTTGTETVTDTHYTSKNVVGGTSTASSNTTTTLTNGNVYLNHIESNSTTPTSSHKVSGSGATTVTSDANGNIIISSTDNNQTIKGNGTSFGTNDAVNIVPGSNVTVTADTTNKKITIGSSHPSVTKEEDSTSEVYPAHGETFTAVDGVKRDTYGHVTKINTKTVTLPAQYTHPTHTATTGVPTADQTPAFGGTFNVNQITNNNLGHVTANTSRKITIPSTLSNGTGTAGLIKTTSTVTSNSGYTASPVINGVPYYKDTTYTSLKNPNALTIQGNGTTLTNGVYDGSTAKTVNITPSAIGAAPSSHNHAAGDITTGTLVVARGGTGITSNPSMLVNLASTSADTVFEASPRPGVTGTLPIANGGTGATSAEAARTNLGAFATSGGTITGSTTFNSVVNVKSGNIEIFGTSAVATPYIDFHYGETTTDYTSRIIESASGELTINNAKISNGKVWGAVWNDYAEFFPRGEETEAGDIIALDLNSDNEIYVKATKDNKAVVGVESNEYGHILGGDNCSIEENMKNYIPVGLAGRVWVKVQGNPKKGDYIGASDIPGVGEVCDDKYNAIGICVDNNLKDGKCRIKII